VRIVQFMASKKYVGAERSFVELSNELAKTDEVIALVVKDCEYKDKFSKNVHIIELQSNSSRFNPLLYIEIISFMKKIKPDIIHTHSVKATQIIYRLQRIINLPFIATKRNSSKKATVFNKVPYAVGVSQEVVDSIDNYNKFLIYNGIEPKPLKNIEKEQIFTMIAIGILQPRKGFKELIEAVKNFSFDYQLWIVGEGEQYKILKELIKSCNLEKKVKLLGQRDDVFLLQERSHLQIINSYREGFSRVLIEGFFYSDVVISTKVAGSTEVLSKEFLFEDAAKKIQEVYENYNLYKNKFAKIKYSCQKRFLLSNVAKEYKKLYNRVINV